MEKFAHELKSLKKNSVQNYSMLEKLLKYTRQGNEGVKRRGSGFRLRPNCVWAISSLCLSVNFIEVPHL